MNAQEPQIPPLYAALWDKPLPERRDEATGGRIMRELTPGWGDDHVCPLCLGAVEAFGMLSFVQRPEWPVIAYVLCEACAKEAQEEVQRIQETAPGSISLVAAKVESHLEKRYGFPRKPVHVEVRYVSGHQFYLRGRILGRIGPVTEFGQGIGIDLAEDAEFPGGQKAEAGSIAMLDPRAVLYEVPESDWYPDELPPPDRRRRFGLSAEEALVLRDRIVGQVAKHRLGERLQSEEPGEELLRMAETVAGKDWLGHADTVIWRDDLFSAALTGWRSFIGTRPTFQVQSASPQLWFLKYGANEKSLVSHAELPPGSHLLCFFAAPGTHPDLGPVMMSGIFFLLPPWRGEGEKLLMSHVCVQPLKDAVSEDFAPVAALLTFLGELWVDLAPQHVHTRQQRKAAERERRPLPAVYVVQLRRALERDNHRGEGEPREWSCSFMVAGHWKRVLRNVAGPNIGKEYRAVWWKPHLRGDPAKPLRQPKGTVYVVNR